MERVLQVYERPFDPLRPVICMDETPNQLIDETRTPIHKSDGTKLIDSEYIRKGTQSIFMAVEPLSGKRFVEARDHHKTADWVAFMMQLIEAYKDAEKITVVLDNLSVHRPEAFYQYFPPAEAKAITDKVEFVFTPPHGSWLNIAEIELNVLIGQCLNRRIPDKQTLRREIQAWQKHRNQRQVKIDWQFNIQDARKKLDKVYPKINQDEQSLQRSSPEDQPEN